MVIFHIERKKCLWGRILNCKVLCCFKSSQRTSDQMPPHRCSSPGRPLPDSPEVPTGSSSCSSAEGCWTPSWQPPGPGRMDRRSAEQCCEPNGQRRPADNGEAGQCWPATADSRSVQWWASGGRRDWPPCPWHSQRPEIYRLFNIFSVI